VTDAAPAAWFLSSEERGNPATGIDRSKPAGMAWTDGNRADPLVHGVAYFARLHDTIRSLRDGDWVHFTDWRGDWDERLDGPGTEVGKVLRDAAGRGVEVMGLIWRSHPAKLHFSQGENLELARMVNEAGGQLFLDERVRRGGSHHQKLFVVRREDEDDDVAFVGGIDLCHSRRDDERHAGDEQAAPLDPKYGARPPWHDVQLEVHGPAVFDLAATFRERWEDPTPLDHRNPVRWTAARLARQPRRPGPIRAMRNVPDPVGTHAVQVLRTYPAKRPAFPFAPDGERSIARAYARAFSRARSLIYIEDQYLWSEEIGGVLAEALQRSPELRVVIVVPAYPDRDGRVSGPPCRLGQLEALSLLQRIGGDRVGVYHVVNDEGRPIYVHSKVCIVDDVWAMVGSDNMSIRSWTHDSELSCAVIDAERDDREPTDPGGSGEGARRFARDLRVRLWSEHLGVDPSAVPLGADDGARMWRDLADANRGRARHHRADPISPVRRMWSWPLYRFLVDPDGRPRELRRRHAF
jgi:phosphatidylserine/phosphatidylglycerophosphate/cardiolipin synthase-like enzyme